MPRTELHHRQLDLRFYARDDGLYEVEARMSDRKPQPFRPQLAQQDTPAGAPIHDITVTLVVDAELRVHEARAQMAATPYRDCQGAQDTLAPLVGLSMARGWNKAVRERLGGAASCTHIVELLGPMATTAFQGLAPQYIARINEPENEALRQAKVDSCYAYAGHREVVQRLWPHLARPKP